MARRNQVGTAKSVSPVQSLKLAEMLQELGKPYE